PSAADNTVTTFEDTTYPFAGADFRFSDPKAVPPNALGSVTIGGLNLGGGTLTLSGSNFAGGSVSAANINAGLLRFKAALNFNGSLASIFTFTVTDNGTPPAADTTVHTISASVTAVNDAPTGTTGTVTFNEDNVYTLKRGDF